MHLSPEFCSHVCVPSTVVVLGRHAVKIGSSQGIIRCKREINSLEERPFLFIADVPKIKSWEKSLTIFFLLPQKKKQAPKGLQCLSVKYNTATSFVCEKIKENIIFLFSFFLFLLPKISSATQSILTYIILRNAKDGRTNFSSSQQ